MENQNKECCLTCYICEIGDLLHDNADNTKKPCKHYPQSMSPKAEFLQVYCCENYKPVIHTTITLDKKQKPDRNQKKRLNALKTMEKQIMKGLETMGFKKVKVVDFEHIIFRAEIRAFIVGFMLGISMGILLIIALTIL